MRTLAAAAIIVVATAACYADGFDGAFVFDDQLYVAENKALHSLWPPYDWLGFCPTRPVGYFTFALNYALHGDAVFGYHVVNLAIHLAAALALFGFTRRTLRLPGIAERYRRRADAFATTAALIWAVHPLGTQAVTYVYQRLESLAALGALVAGYAFVRAYGESGRPRLGWSICSTACTYAALLTKESVVALPLLMLIYDRLFIARSWRGVLTRRRYHTAAFCSWGVVLGLMSASVGDYERAGIGAVEGLSAWSYARSQPGVILHYLRLSLLPVGLCLDYQWPWARHWYEFVPQTIVVFAASVLTLRGLLQGKLWSFPACAFFLLLAPTSSIIPIADLIYEHRMYLPSATVIVLGGCGAVEAAERLILCRLDAAGQQRFRRVGMCAVAAVVVAFGVLTYERNRDYRSYEVMWRDVVDKAPHNERACANLADCLMRQARYDEAQPYLARALEINPRYSFALWLTAGLHLARDERRQAERYLVQALAVKPDYALAHNDLGLIYFEQGRESEAVAEFLAALESDPLHAEARANLGMMLIHAGRTEEGLDQIRRAIADNERFIDGRISLGLALVRLGRLDEAVAELEQALALEPSNEFVRENLQHVRRLQASAVTRTDGP